MSEPTEQDQRRVVIDGGAFLAKNVEAIESFVARHGGRPIPLDGVVLLPSGATYSVANPAKFAPESRTEPPSDELALLTAKRRYQAAWAMRTRDAFDRIKAEALRHPSRFYANVFSWDRAFGDPPTELDEYGHPSAQAALKKLKRLYDGFKAAIEKIDRAIAENPKAVIERERRESIERAKERAVAAGEQAERNRLAWLSKIVLEE